MVSTLNKGVSGVTGYFGLRAENDALQLRNAELESEALNLNHRIRHLQTLIADTGAIKYPADRFSFITASVLNNRIISPRNYFTINRGSLDGVHPGMGVVDHNGVVGIVNVAALHTSRVISLLNVDQRISAKIKNTDVTGTLTWEPGNPKIAYLEEIPRHFRYHVGDTVVTSGYSTTFPEGLPLGVVMAQVRGNNDNAFTLKVKVASDFKSLNKVRVIQDFYKAELDTLENYDITDDKKY